MALKRAKRRRKSLAERLAPELRARIVEAMLDAARERRKIPMDGFMAQAMTIQHQDLATKAVLHALELADQHLILTGEVEP